MTANSKSSPEGSVGHSAPEVFTATSAFDMFDTLARPPQLSDPYPFYTWLRANHPVYLGADGTAYVCRYEHAKLLKDPGLRDALDDDTHSYTLHTLNQSLVKAVPPRHSQLRRAGAAVFDREVLTQADIRIRETAEHLADRFAVTLARDGTADIHTEYSLPLTQRTAAIVFGIPDEDVDMLAMLPARMFQALYPKATSAAVTDADEASRTLFTYMQEAIRQRRFAPGSGFARLIDTAGSTLADDVARLCWILWWASYTSALAAIDLAILTLTEHPQTAPLLRQHTHAWVEEALRYRSAHVVNSANLTTRYEITIGTVTLPPHTPVRFMLAAMNRDESAFPHANVFDPHRNGTPHHIAFGNGIHSCIAAQLARMEIAVALTTLAARLPCLALVGQPVWRPYTTQRLCGSFPVTTAPVTA